MGRAGDRLVAGGRSGHVLLSDDHGLTWRQIIVPTTSLLVDVAFADASRGMVVGHDAVILETQDGGESWRRLHWAPDLEAPLMAVTLHPDGSAIAAGAYGLYMESFDGGETWRDRFIADEELHFNQILDIDARALVIVGELGGIYRTQDAGFDWQSVGGFYEGSLFGAAKAGEALIAFGLQGQVFRSTDQGARWQPVDSGVEASLFGATVLEDGRLVVVGASGTVLVSDDQGQSFREYRVPGRVGLTGIVQAADGALILTGDQGLFRVPDVTALPRVGPDR